MIADILPFLAYKLSNCLLNLMESKGTRNNLGVPLAAKPKQNKRYN